MYSNKAEICSVAIGNYRYTNVQILLKCKQLQILKGFDVFGKGIAPPPPNKKSPRSYGLVYCPST